MAKRGDPIDGVMMLDKPEGMTSNRALQMVRRLINAQKAGHTGTLDPMATGLLPLCFGNATKFSADLLHADKGYVARVKLGERTDTGDAEGEVVERLPVPQDLTLETIREAAKALTGPIDQIPPMYSALKRDGKPLYEYAREGETLEREPRKITVHELEVLDFDGESFTMATLVSKGTYIRVLAEDLGQRLGLPAHLTALRRTRVGDLTLADAVTMASLEATDLDGARAQLAPSDRLLQSLPEVMLDEPEAKRFMHGQRLALRCPAQPRVRVYGPGKELLGTARINAGGVLEPERLIAH